MHGPTVAVSPPDGNMQDYLDSLEKLKNYDLTTLLLATVNFYLTHIQLLIGSLTID